MSSKELREKFQKFFTSRGHKVVPSSSLIPADPSVLLTSAGMQQFIPYFTGQANPEEDFGSKKLFSFQKVFRTVDIDEVGDESHLTFFEMMGNFSIGDYFKEGAIPLSFEFITSEEGLGLDPQRLYVTAFKGDDEVSRDEEAIKLWQEQFRSVGIEAKIGERIFLHGREENWWEVGLGPSGPDSEMFYDTGKQHDLKFGSTCEPSCECGKFVEIGNDVFIQYNKVADGEYRPLKMKSVDNGRGFERLVMFAQGKDNIFETDLFKLFLDQLGDLPEKSKRIIVDHVRAICFLISDGVRPSNQGTGYILRRLIRRVVILEKDVSSLVDVIVVEYKDFYSKLNKEDILLVYKEEQGKFEKTLEKGLRELEKLDKVNVKDAFRLFQSYGLPYEVIKDVGGDKVGSLTREEFDKEFSAHQEVSRAGAGTFKGGLADDKPETIKLHTAHHLLLAALQQVLGSHIKQRGSNVTSERLRIDFSHSEKMTDEEIKKVEDLVNEKIQEELDVIMEEMPKEEAVKLGAEMEFGKNYGDIVSVYTIKNKDGSIFSREFCGGPHVKNTSELGHFSIKKESSASAGIRRIKAVID